MTERNTEQVDLEFTPPLTRAKLLEVRWSSWLWPAFPGLSGEARRRWSPTGGWSPPGTALLSRFVDLGTMEYVVALGDAPEPRFAHDFSLGVVQRWEVPGTRQLIADGDDLRLADVNIEVEIGDQDNEASDGPALRELGWIEQAWFVLMDPLELRRVPDTGQLVLCVDRNDPLRDQTEFVSRIGFVESLPLHPNPALRRQVGWGFVPLHRTLDLGTWRHRYGIGEPPAGGVYLGAATDRPRRGDIPLSLGPDGRLSTPVLPPRPRPRSVVELARWTSAPLKWARELDESPVELMTDRLRKVRNLRADRAERVVPQACGWVAAAPDPEHPTAALYSATHPATGDQFVTRSEWEASDMGYEIDGVLGYAYDPPMAKASRTRDPSGSIEGPAEIPWGSRLGRSRRRTGGP